MSAMLSDPWMAAVPAVKLMDYRPFVPTELDLVHAASRAQVGYDTLRAWVKAGRLPVKLDAFGVMTVHPDDLDQAVRNRPLNGRPQGSWNKDLVPGIRSGRFQTGGLVLLALEGNFVRCRCDCGDVVELTKFQFRYRLRCKTGCPKRNQGKRRKRAQSFVGHYNRLVRGDRQNRSFEVSLTYDEYVAIRSSGLCVYCNGKLSRFCIGLDRIDNTRGYHKDNVVVCCAYCNFARGHLLSADEFKAALAVRRAALPPGSDLWSGYEWPKAMGRR
jgi:hypothetical protein